MMKAFFNNLFNFQAEEKKLVLKTCKLTCALSFILNTFYFGVRQSSTLTQAISYTSLNTVGGAVSGLVMGYLILLYAQNHYTQPENLARIERAIQRLREELRQEGSCFKPITLTKLPMIEDSQLSKEYFCPITKEIMLDPVALPDGRSYERHAIQAWYNKGYSFCPLNPRMQLANPASQPTNLALQQCIQREIDNVARAEIAKMQG